MARLIPLIEDHLDEIRALCIEYGVSRLEVFGSAANGTFRPETSDLDFIATFADPGVGTYADRYLDLAESLEALFSRRVDLMTERSIRSPRFRREVDATRRVVYPEYGQEAVA
jgi:predicted nucleotidyltransferase